MQNPPPPTGARRVDGARALARAFVLQAEALTRITNLTKPRYGRLSLVQLHDAVSQVHALCRDTAWAIAQIGEPMPNERSKYAPLTKEMWTAQGDNGKDPPMNVGVFGSQRDAHHWCDRQNETQSSEAWGRGSAGPMHFTPKPIYQARGLDPKVLVLPERQWDAPEERR